MNRDQINNRLEVLFIVLQFSRWNDYHGHKTVLFTVGERIMINQERGSLLRKTELPDYELRAVSKNIENKIAENWRKIDETNFTPLDENELSNL